MGRDSSRRRITIRITISMVRNSRGRGAWVSSGHVFRKSIRKIIIIIIIIIIITTTTTTTCITVPVAVVIT